MFHDVIHFISIPVSKELSTQCHALVQQYTFCWNIPMQCLEKHIMPGMQNQLQPSLELGKDLYRHIQMSRKWNGYIQ